MGALRTKMIEEMKNAQPSVFAGMCLPTRKSHPESPSDRLYHRENLETDLNRCRHPYLSPTSCCTPCCPGALQSHSPELRSAPRFSPTSFYPKVATAGILFGT
jgi:hypothetical protein